MLAESNHVLPSFLALLSPAKAKHDLSPQQTSAHSLLTSAPAWESASSWARLCRAEQPCTQPGVWGRAAMGSGVGTQILVHR